MRGTRAVLCRVPAVVRVALIGCGALTFLVGVYGMNFQAFPELQWRYGYLYFWGLVVASVTTLLHLLRRSRLL